jgi:hypothetical protein
MSVWLAVLIVFGWLLLAVTVGMVIGRVCRGRNEQKPVAKPCPPRGNVDLTTAVRPVVRDVPRN